MAVSINWAGYYQWSRYLAFAAPAPPHVISVCTEPPSEEPFTLDEIKLRAGLDWTPPDPRDQLMIDFLRAARAKVEQDTGLALLEQTREIYLDVVRGTVIVLPWQSLPLIADDAITTVDTAGVAHVLDPAAYLVDYASGRIALAQGSAWPTNLQSFQPWTITIRAGWPTPADLALEAPALRHAVGLLAAHYATLGRDTVIEDRRVTETPHGYDDVIAPYLAIAVV
jgi:uncharacterized phiE125 gp8 family phage protein